MIAFDSWVIDSSYLYGFLCNIWISQFSHSEDCIQRSHDPSPGSVPAWVLVATEPRILRHTVLPVAQSFFDYGFPFQWPTSKASPLEPKSVAYVRTHTHTCSLTIFSRYYTYHIFVYNFRIASPLFWSPQHWSPQPPRYGGVSYSSRLSMIHVHRDASSTHLPESRRGFVDGTHEDDVCLLHRCTWPMELIGTDILLDIEW